jgi:hypothetical protein
LEQRVLIQSVAPLLATTLSAAIAHDQVASIDGTNLKDREALYAVLDGLISNRSQWSGPSHLDERLSIIRVSWQLGSTSSEQQESMHETLLRAIAAATSTSGHLIRLSNAEMLIAAPQRVLSSAGLEPSAKAKTPRHTHIQVIEIANSLQLREVLGLTQAGEAPAAEKPLIH